MPVRPFAEPEAEAPKKGQPIAYAGASDVVAFNKGRVPGVGQNPSLTDIKFYLETVAAEIDGILIDKGYQLPIATNATGALLMLRRINAQGAALEVEQASPSSSHLERFRKAYEESIDMLKTADLVMNVAKSDERAKPRGPGVTVAPGVRTNAEYEREEREIEVGLVGEALGRSIPYFRRGMTF
jgi:hypothetical protein